MFGGSVFGRANRIMLETAMHHGGPDASAPLLRPGCVSKRLGYERRKHTLDVRCRGNFG